MAPRFPFSDHADLVACSLRIQGGDVAGSALSLCLTSIEACNPSSTAARQVEMVFITKVGDSYYVEDSSTSLLVAKSILHL